jgi:hypothetical protein
LALAELASAAGQASLALDVPALDDAAAGDALADDASSNDASTDDEPITVTDGSAHSAADPSPAAPLLRAGSS